MSQLRVVWSNKNSIKVNKTQFRRSRIQLVRGNIMCEQAKDNIIRWNEHKHCGALVPLALSSLVEGQQMKIRLSSVRGCVCMCQRVRESEEENETQTENTGLKTQDRMWDSTWFSAQTQAPHYREWREVLLCVQYKAWAETPSLSKYYYRQQFPTEFSVETQRVRLGHHAPASHLKTSFHAHPLHQAQIPSSFRY